MLTICTDDKDDVSDDEAEESELERIRAAERNDDGKLIPC